MKLLLFFLLLFSCGTFCQELPPIQNYAPSEYGAENQNWAISQSEDKLIYVANNEGLLEFNGANWKLFKSPNQTILRSVNVVKDRIYTGCYMEFGYWTKNTFGTLEYTSLSKSFKNDLLEDEEFWDILHLDDWVLFQSKKRIYIYDLTEKSITSIDAASSLPRIWSVGQSIYFHVIHEGLYRIERGNKILVYNEKPIKNDEVVSFFEHRGRQLLLTRHQGFNEIFGEGIRKWETEIDPFLANNSVYSSLQLTNGKIAIGTISDGLFLLDGNGRLIYHINEQKGLRNNTVLSLYKDLDNTVWLGLDNGVSYINLDSPYTIYNGILSDIGSVYDAIAFGGYLYLGTNQGLFYKKISEETDFFLINGTQGQVWDLTIVDGTLLCGHHTGTFEINGETAKRIVNIAGTWNIKSITEDENLLLQGNYDGLYVLEKKGGQWKLRNKISGFDNSSRHVEIFGNQIFINHEYKGLFKVTTDNSLTKAIEVKIDTTVRGDNSGIIKYQGTLLYANKNGIFRYNHAADTISRDSLLSAIYSETDYVSGKMVANDEEIWVFTKDNLTLVSPGNLSDKYVIREIPLSEDFRDGISGYENIIPYMENGKYLLCTSSGYIILDTKRIKDEKFGVNIGEIRRISKNSPSKENILIDKNSQGDFSYRENSFFILFFSPQFYQYTKPKYQHRLLGIYPNWSEWSENASATFENLPYGDYTFEVRSKIGDTLSINTAAYSFTIQKPWYQTNLAWAIYSVTALVGFFLLHTMYRHHYKKRQQKLVQKNEHKMQLTKAENEKEIIKLKNEQLRQRYRLKSNELAASTMSLIRKNNVLNEVKSLLAEKVADKRVTEPIVKIIDNSLNRNDDWELFKEAFNNADKEFLNKLKSAHSNLTQNDIRLCAYLRLNLSSKEIAPLFNISPRSVEVKRYRLRKKMGLDHDENLVDYILGL